MAGGYEDNLFIDAPPESVQCPVCLLVLREPQVLSCCGVHICQVGLCPIQVTLINLISTI